MEWFSLTVRIDSRKAGPSRHLCHKLFRLMREHLRGRDLDSTVDLILEELLARFQLQRLSLRVLIR